MFSLEQKQKYLRDNVPQQQYQQFFQFTNQQMENLDIQNWSKEFLINLVRKFKQFKQKQNQGNHQTSFYIYQQNQNKQQNKHQTEQIKIPKKNAQKPEDKINNKPTNPYQILDSLFQPNKNKIETVQPIPIVLKNQSKIKKQNNLPKIDITSFNSNYFWDFKPQTARQKTSANNNTKLSHSGVDFGTFDFWSNSNSLNSSPNKDNHKQVSMPFTLNTSPISLPENALTFQQMLKNQGPSPYLKKSNVESTQGIQPSQKNTSKNIQKQKSNLKVQVRQSKTVINRAQALIKNEFNDTVKCFHSLERKQLNESQLSITIQNHEIVNRTFLMPDYVMYTLRINPLNITCKRNYQDFSRLKNTLSQLFPGIKLAYLQKNSWFSSTNVQFIKKQKVMLQFFINDIVKNKQLRNSRILQDFLTLNQHKKIKRKFEEWQKLEKPKSIQQLCLLQGKVEVVISQNQRIYQESLKKIHGKTIQFLEKHEKLSQILTQQYKEISTTIQSMREQVKLLLDQVKLFNDKVVGLQFLSIDKSLKKMYSFYNQQIKHTKFNIEIFENKVIPLFSYQKQNLRQFSDIIQLQQNFLKTYLKRISYERLEEISYTSEVLKPSKQGILQMSSHINVLKYQTGFLSNQLCLEGHRIFETLGSNIGQLLLQISQKIRIKRQSDLQFWKKMASKISVA